MAEAGHITEAQAKTWQAKPLRVKRPPNLFRTHSPHFAEHVRRDATKRYGKRAVWEGGLDIETTLVPWIDQAAQENVDFSLRKLDKRQGWRGPVAHLAGGAAVEFRRRATQRYGEAPLAEGRLALGLVESVDGRGARVRVGSQEYAMPPDAMRWAVPYSTSDATNDRQLTSTARVVRPGDVVWVTPLHQSRLRRFSDWTYDENREVQWRAAFENRAAPPGPPQMQLEQEPYVEGAFFVYDHQTGYVVSMVGGRDYDRSEFNRVVQACRQPGSAYKPVYYSLALNEGYGYGTLLNDIPRAEVDPITGEVWTPTNLNNTVEYQVSLAYALTWSKNVPSVQLFNLVGARQVEAWARRLGFTSPIIADQALSLGASCTYLHEMTRAFSAFARNGSLRDHVSIRRVRSRDGAVLEDSTHPSDPMGAPGVRLDRLVALAGATVSDAIPPRTAWLTSQLLRKVVSHGHAPALRSTKLPVAGKTGTSSATMDVWFTGYTSRWMMTAWIGDDKRERQLGFKDAAYMITVPMVARFLSEVTPDQALEEIPWTRPDGVKPNDTGGHNRRTMEDVAGR
jgi:penicillin-binding protein 1A